MHNDSARHMAVAAMLLAILGGELTWSLLGFQSCCITKLGQHTYLVLRNSRNHSILILILPLTLTFEVNLKSNSVISIFGLRRLSLPKITSKDAKLAKQEEHESSDRQNDRHSHTYGQDQKEPPQEDPY